MVNTQSGARKFYLTVGGKNSLELLSINETKSLKIIVTSCHIPDTGKDYIFAANGYETSYLSQLWSNDSNSDIDFSFGIYFFGKFYRFLGKLDGNQGATVTLFSSTKIMELPDTTYTYKMTKKHYDMVRQFYFFVSQLMLRNPNVSKTSELFYFPVLNETTAINPLDPDNQKISLKMIGGGGGDGGTPGGEGDLLKTVQEAVVSVASTATDLGWRFGSSALRKAGRAWNAVMNEGNQVTAVPRSSTGSSAGGDDTVTIDPIDGWTIESSPVTESRRSARNEQLQSHLQTTFGSVQEIDSLVVDSTFSKYDEDATLKFTAILRHQLAESGPDENKRIIEGVLNVLDFAKEKHKQVVDVFENSTNRFSGITNIFTTYQIGIRDPEAGRNSYSFLLNLDMTNEKIFQFVASRHTVPRTVI